MKGLFRKGATKALFRKKSNEEARAAAAYLPRAGATVTTSQTVTGLCQRISPTQGPCTQPTAASFCPLHACPTCGEEKGSAA